MYLQIFIYILQWLVKRLAKSVRLISRKLVIKNYDNMQIRCWSTLSGALLEAATDVKLPFLNGLEYRHADSTIGLGLKSSIIFIYSFKKLSKRSRSYALYKMMIKWPFFWVFMVNYGHIRKAVISKQSRAQTRGFYHWIGLGK